ncbi:hypothetical protein A4H97_08135 [Niastella yeongjuensis]|uniref:Uncharacterized protein n=1 Tax=Niastella yeongjuensis TaxID=354355 RepID=A0A1V9EN41_9BACT|nr:hypothetical protein A4H97_08135 [Niastella yeongjuensis]
MSYNALYNEKELLQNIAQGDERAFFSFYDHYSALLRPFLFKYTRVESDVEEIVQETFIKIWVNRDDLATIENVKAWVFKIASRTYLNYLKKAIREKKRNLIAGSGTAVETVTPFERTSVGEISAAIKQAIGKLSEQKKRVYAMSREQGLMPMEIAEKLGIPVGTVKNQLSAALKEIREHLIASGHGPVLIIYTLIKIF